MGPASNSGSKKRLLFIGLMSPTNMGLSGKSSATSLFIYCRTNHVIWLLFGHLFWKKDWDKEALFFSESYRDFLNCSHLRASNYTLYSSNRSLCPRKHSNGFRTSRSGQFNSWIKNWLLEFLPFVALEPADEKTFVRTLPKPHLRQWSFFRCYE